jgi:hypothetical protein
VNSTRIRNEYSVRWLRFSGIYLIAALFAVGVLLINLWPWHPRSWQAWLLFVVLAPPLLLAGELLGEAALHNPVADAVGRATSRKTFSWMRVTYGVTAALTLTGTALLAAHFLAR